MHDKDYDYIAGRLAVERNRARIAACQEAAAAHQTLANAYLARLRLMSDGFA